MTNFEIPEAVTTLGDEVFRGCKKLAYIEIPTGIKNIGEGVFQGCLKLAQIDVKDNNSMYSSEDGILFNKEKTEIICYPAGKEGMSYIVPDKVTIIGEGAFYECKKLKNIVLPQFIKSIDRAAFSGCENLANMEIPEGATNIGGSAFWGCKSLLAIEIPSTVVNIGGNAFYGCKELDNIKIPQGVTCIEDYTFMWCTNLTNVELPIGMTKIGWSAFSNCPNLKKIEIPNTVNKIGRSAFESCSSLVNIEIPEGVTSIDEKTFYKCTNLVEVKLPSTLLTIGEYAFSSCNNLSNIVIPENVYKIGRESFYKCESLKNIELPEGVTTIEMYAYIGCTVKNLEIPDTISTIGMRAFDGCTIEKIIQEGSTEIEIPNVIKRAMQEDDILYSEEGFEFINCALSESKNNIILDLDKGNMKMTVKSGNLKGLVLAVYKSGTITYSTTEITDDPVVAKIHIAEDEIITNNNGKNTYIFTENGEFIFEYKNVDGDLKIAKAKVTNIGKNVEKEITSEKYEIENSYITKIKEKTTIEDLKNNIKTNATEINIYNKDGELQEESNILATGMRVEIKFNNEVQNYTIVVKGDLNGDGEMNDIDLLRMARYQAELDKNLDGAYLKASNIYEDENNADNIDLLKMVRVLAGLDTY